MIMPVDYARQLQSSQSLASRSRNECMHWHPACTQPPVGFHLPVRSFDLWTRLRITKAPSAPVAPRCDVTASNSTQKKPGQPARFSFVAPASSPAVAGGVSPAHPGQQTHTPYLPHRPPRSYPLTSLSRKTFTSSSAVVNPSGKVPRLYSAIRFFHFRKSVILCGSIRTSTRRKLASSRFIS